MTTEPNVIVLVCTDRGRHAQVVLHTEIVHSPDTATVDSMATTSLPGSRMEFPCEQCGRNPQIRHMRAAEFFGPLLDYLRQGNARVELDLSYLDR